MHVLCHPCAVCGMLANTFHKPGAYSSSEGSKDMESAAIDSHKRSANSVTKHSRRKAVGRFCGCWCCFISWMVTVTVTCTSEDESASTRGAARRKGRCWLNQFWCFGRLRSGEAGYVSSTCDDSIVEELHVHRTDRNWGGRGRARSSKS